MSDIGDWYRSLPLFTRHWFSLSVIFPIAARFGLLDPSLLILSPKVWSKFQIWRVFTSIFYYPTGFHYLMNLYFLYNYSLRLETGPEFNGRPADYLFLLIFNWLISLILAYSFGIPILMDPMVLSILYVWCQFNKEMVVSFLFGTRMKAMYLPWILLGFNMLMGGSALFEIIGILVGHLYYFSVVKYPDYNNGVRLITTPSFLEYYFPSTRNPGGVSGSGFNFMSPPSSRSDRSSETRHRWGRGQTLGSS